MACGPHGAGSNPRSNDRQTDPGSAPGVTPQARWAVHSSCLAAGGSAWFDCGLSSADGGKSVPLWGQGGRFASCGCPAAPICPAVPVRFMKITNDPAFLSIRHHLLHGPPPPPHFLRLSLHSLFVTNAKVLEPFTRPPPTPPHVPLTAGDGLFCPPG